MNTQTLERPVEQATLTVQYVNPAKDPRKSGSIKDIDGQYFGVRPMMLEKFAPGETYEVEFTSKVVNGVMYRDIVGEPILAQQSRPPQRPQPAQAARAPAQRSAPVAETPREPQRPAPHANGNGNGNSYYRPTSPRDAKRMFICSTLNAFIQTGRLDCKAQAIADAVAEISAAYDGTIGQEDQAG